MNDKLKLFINSQARNKLIVSADLSIDIEYIDIGKLLSEKLEKVKIDKRFSLKAKSILEELFHSNIVFSKRIGEYLALRNLGVLFEPELKLDFLVILDKFSRDNTLFIYWEGEIENNNLYFLSKEKGKKINIKNLSHIAI